MNTSHPVPLSGLPTGRDGLELIALLLYATPIISLQIEIACNTLLSTFLSFQSSGLQLSHKILIDAAGNGDWGEEALRSGDLG